MDPDAADFEDRFDELARVARRVAFRLVGDAHEADDVAQETMARCYARWERVQGYAEPWVARVAANLALGQLRRGRAAQTAARRHGDGPPATPDGLDAALTRAELVDALRRLPRRQRDVVVLRYVADLPEAAVAELLGCSTGSVKTHGHRGLRALRIQLDDDLRLAGGLR